MDEKTLQGLPVRVRRMARWLLLHQAEITAPESVQVTFSCKDRSVWVELIKKDKIDTGPLGNLNR